jgi:cysteinyl-tRNA synthetase
LTTRQVALKYEQSFKHYLTELNIEPFIYARATEYIPAQIGIVKQLENKNLTYIISGDGIYMDTSLVPDYGKLM